ncbi:hypothetical protein ACFL0W_04650 [Nanoarchaeota archaeon]
MIWQDIVIMIATIILSVSLVPQVYHCFKKKKGTITPYTSVPTLIGLYVIAFSFFTLKLYFSAVVTTITGTLWLVLFIQRIVYKKKK